MKRVVSLVNERWADGTNPAYPQVDLTVGSEFEIIDHFADQLVMLGKAKYAEDNQPVVDVNPATAKPVMADADATNKKGVWKKR